MRIHSGAVTCFALALFAVGFGVAPSAIAAEDPELKEKVERLVSQLDADERAQRDDAEKQLVELGLQGGGDAFLALLPKPNEDMPQEVQTRLARIRGQVQTRLSRQAVAETRLTLDFKKAPLADVLKEVEKQTGNRVVDFREKFGQETMEKKITVKVDDVPFWSGMDQILDAANMSPYPPSGEAALALIEREPGALRRFGRAAYAGPFRIEAISISSERGLRSPEQSYLRMELDIGWEPRLEPLAITQAASDLEVMCDDGRKMPPSSEDAVFDVEVPRGMHAADASLALQLPAREAKKIESLRGKMTALVPGRMVDLEFKDLKTAKDVKQETGGVTVTLDRVVKNQALWEVHMRVRVGGLEAGIESHQGWIFQNVTFLKDKNGEQIDHAGYETTMQTEREAGFAYFFETPEDISNYTWIYRTPTAIVNLPVEYELKDVPLP